MESSTSHSSDIENTTSNAAGITRYFYVGMALFLMLFVVLGFGSTYGLQLLMGKEISGHNFVETDWAIHIHAAVFVGWMLLLITQTALIARGQTLKHMAVGKTVGVGLAVAVILAGSLITYEFAQAINSIGLVAWSDWPSMILATMPSWYSLLSFAILMGLGLVNRNQPPAHKRYMIFATIMLANAATSRMEYLLGSWDTYIGTGIMVAPLIAFDLYNERRIRPATLIGTGFAGFGLIGHYVVISVFT